MKLWCYEDTHYWGEGLAQVARARGWDVELTDDPHQVVNETREDAVVFWHMHHHPSVRTMHKRAMQLMAMNPLLHLVPDYRSSQLFDDKVEQSRQLARYLPRTHLFYSPRAAREWLESAEFPFISKTSEGAASHNVRLINNYKDAHEEIKQAFSDRGIRCRYALAQRGYLMWQQFIPGNGHDLRVIAVGSKRLILKRYNRDDKPMASGSGKLEPVKKLDDESHSALQYANEFFARERMPWSGIDLVRDANRWYVLECTVSWTMSGYEPCTFWHKDAPVGTYGRVTRDGADATGKDVWNVLLDEVEHGSMFDRPTKAHAIA